uniref:Uncharacterized protein n=1 Tax=Serinus canaria TaxID=9135 RepID=A0A8C9MMD5_SERCA
TSCSPGLSTDSRQLPTFLPHLHATDQPWSSPFAKHTHKFKHVPVKDVVIGEALAVEEVAEELPWREQRTPENRLLIISLPTSFSSRLMTWTEIDSPLVMLLALSSVIPHPL